MNNLCISYNFTVQRQQNKFAIQAYNIFLCRTSKVVL